MGISQSYLLSDVANVLEVFEIDKVQNCKYLEEWSNSSGKIAEYQLTWLEEVRSDLSVHWSLWNEEELKMNFVSAVFRAANVNEPDKIATFYERQISGELSNIKLSLVCDCMIAAPSKGNRPTKPYFFFQEFKRGKGDKYDPEAQMLVSMLLAQQANSDNKPIYGAWLQGKFWHFAVLNQNEYCVGTSYEATEIDELIQIVLTLKNLKKIVL